MTLDIDKLTKINDSVASIKKALQDINLSKGHGLDIVSMYLTDDKGKSIAYLQFYYSKQGKVWEESINLNVV